MKILHFIACMMMPVSIMNNGYAMENIGNNKYNRNAFMDTGCNNPILRIFQNDSDNNLMNTYLNTPESEDINIGRLHLDSSPSDFSNSNIVSNHDIKSERQMFGKIPFPPFRNNQKYFAANNQKDNNISKLNISNFRIDVDTKYENLMNEMVELERLLSSNTKMNSNINSQEVITMINNIFDDMNNNNKYINIMSLKQICNKYDSSNTIYNKIKCNNILTEHKTIKLIDDLLDNFIQYVSCKKQVDNIDEINKELTDKINIAIDNIINSNNKYSCAKVKVVIDKDLDKRNKLEAELREKKVKYNAKKLQIFRTLRLANDFTNGNFIKNILRSSEDEIIIKMTTLYDILNNEKYISDNIADEIYNNIIDKDLEYSHKICKCLENILKIKGELKQLWNSLKNNKLNKINNNNNIDNRNKVNDNNNIISEKNNKYPDENHNKSSINLNKYNVLFNTEDFKKSSVDLVNKENLKKQSIDLNNGEDSDRSSIDLSDTEKEIKKSHVNPNDVISPSRKVLDKHSMSSNNIRHYYKPNIRNYYKTKQNQNNIENNSTNNIYRRNSK